MFIPAWKMVEYFVEKKKSEFLNNFSFLCFHFSDEDKKWVNGVKQTICKLITIPTVYD